MVVAAEHHLNPPSPQLHPHNASPVVTAQPYPHDEQFINTNSNLYMWEPVAADDEIEFENDLIASTNERLFDRKQMMLELDSDFHHYDPYEHLELVNQPPQNHLAPATVRVLASLY